MKPRITISMRKGGEVEVWLNEAGRDLLVRELQALNSANDHFHLQPEGLLADVPLQTRPYQKGDQILDWGKVLFRTDEWDAEHYPHVLEPPLVHGS